jgi:endonuclease/exonuclease/phosphatase family metal-dependent hydrolase
VFVRAGVVPQRRRVWVDGQTRDSDHQPVALQLG